MDPRPRLPPALMEELVEEILLRFPPDDPAGLVRAALVCKRWRRLISGAGFRRRFRELHRTPPVLGFLCNIKQDDDDYAAHFVPTTSFRPVPPPHAGYSDWQAVDARHGRVLLYRVPWGHYSWWNSLVDWDPIMDERREVPELPLLSYPRSWNAAVLCAAGGRCNHLGCHRGPFRVVFLGIDDKMSVYVYSSKTGAWSEPASAVLPEDSFRLEHSALAGNALHFKLWLRAKILKYNLATRKMSVIPLPPRCSKQPGIMIMTTEDGKLGFYTVHGSQLHLWSRTVGPGRHVRWARIRVVELKTLLPIDAPSVSRVVGFADDVGVIFLWTKVGFFTLDLQSSQVRKVGECNGFYRVFPYTSFHTPALEAASTGVRPRAGASCA